MTEGYPLPNDTQALRQTEAYENQYWLGRPVVDSEGLAGRLAELCGTKSLVTTNASQLVFPMMRRHAMAETATWLDLDHALHDFKRSSPADYAGDEIILPIEGQFINATAVRQRGDAARNNPQPQKKIAIQLVIGSQYQQLKREYQSLNRRVDANEFHPMPTALRIVEATTPIKSKRAVAMIRQSGLFKSAVHLGPLTVCSNSRETFRP